MPFINCDIVRKAMELNIVTDEEFSKYLNFLQPMYVSIVYLRIMSVIDCICLLSYNIQRLQ